MSYHNFLVAVIGSTRETPGESCLHLLDLHGQLKSGLFWVQMDEPVRMYCDMTTDGGETQLFSSAVKVL